MKTPGYTREELFKEMADKMCIRDSISIFMYKQPYRSTRVERAVHQSRQYRSLECNDLPTPVTVSYTHLDVYKRQPYSYGTYKIPHVENFIPI